MIELNSDELVFRFPEVHECAELRVTFQRTLRIPDDNREYLLPPGLGRFPLRLVDDYTSRTPASWQRHGGVLLPMHQTEAMWIDFEASYPMAVKVAAGKINALTGDQWSNDLRSHPQDYLVVPDQPWLDGFCIEKGLIRQFVAMPLGEGYTAEEQLTGEAQHGGLQIVAYPMKASAYEEMRVQGALVDSRSPQFDADFSARMGLAPGGLMRQEVYEDEYGLDAWCTAVRSRCFVHILNSLQYLSVTGTEPPQRPVTAGDYTDAGLPWFDHYGGDLTALEGSKKLLEMESVGVLNVKKGKGPLADNDPLPPMSRKNSGGHIVREGPF